MHLLQLQNESTYGRTVSPTARWAPLPPGMPGLPVDRVALPLVLYTVQRVGRLNDHLDFRVTG